MTTSVALLPADEVHRRIRWTERQRVLRDLEQDVVATAHRLVTDVARDQVLAMRIAAIAPMTGAILEHLRLCLNLLQQEVDNAE